MTTSHGEGGRGAVAAGIRGVALVFLLAMGHSVQVQADELFRWIDSEGRVHFGDRPPSADVEHVDRLDMPSFAAPGLPADQDPYSILNQLGRLETDRQTRERERREKAWADREYQLRRRELEAREHATESSDTGTVRGYPVPVYPAYPTQGPGRPPGHRPGRPEFRPPRRPPGFWEPDHPAYRPRPPFVVPRPPVGAPRLGGGARIDLRR